MNFENFTIKAQEAVNKAQEIATEQNNQAIENIHLLKGIIVVDENVIPLILKTLMLIQQCILQTIDKVLRKSTTRKWWTTILKPGTKCNTGKNPKIQERAW